MSSMVYVLRVCPTCWTFIRGIRGSVKPVKNQFLEKVRFSPTQEVLFPQEAELDRKIDVSPIQFKRKLKLAPEAAQKPKLLKLAILGSPNAGKSVLTNYLVGANVSVVSKKVHTTRKLTTAVAVEGETQMIFFDSPGILSPEKRKKLKLEHTLLKDPEFSIKRAELIAVVVDVSNPLAQARLDSRVLHLLNRYSEKRGILVLNKIDLIGDKGRLLEIASRLTKGLVAGQQIARKEPKLLQGDYEDQMNIDRMLREKRNKADECEDVGTEDEVDKLETPRESFAKILQKPMHEVLESQLKRYYQQEIGWPHFEAVFMVSALTGDGMDDLRKYLIKQATDHEWQYHSTVMTDQNPVQLAAETIRGKLLDNLPQEIPYSLQLKIVVWEVNEHDVLNIRMDVICEHARIAKLVIGPKGKIIKQISQEANQELRNLFQRDVYLKLGVMSLKQ